MCNCSVNSAGTSCDVDGGAYGLINLATVGADASYVEYNSTLNDVCRTYEYKDSSTRFLTVCEMPQTPSAT